MKAKPEKPLRQNEKDTANIMIKKTKASINWNNRGRDGCKIEPEGGKMSKDQQSKTENGKYQKREALVHQRKWMKPKNLNSPLPKREGGKASQTKWQKEHAALFKN